LSSNTGNNLWLVVGSWTLGVMVSGVIFFTIFNRPVEKVDDIRDDLRVVKIAILILIGLIVIGGMYVGVQS
tara:strand:- start:3638 stop:3850 length:213 start_codon:yes stop_codon:yes gene_type:complete